MRQKRFQHTEIQNKSNLKSKPGSHSSKNSIDWCNGPIKYLDPPGPITALASAPGSGNTWARYLIQQMR